MIYHLESNKSPLRVIVIFVVLCIGVDDRVLERMYHCGCGMEKIFNIFVSSMLRNLEAIGLRFLPPATQ